jgi:DNA polymerase-3 subunit beta
VRRIEISSDVFLKALTLAAQVAKEGSNIPIMRQSLIRCDSNGLVLEAFATSAIRYSLSGAASGPFRMVIPTVAVLRTLGQFTEPVALTIEDDSTRGCRIQWPSGSMKIAYGCDEDFPALPSAPEPFLQVGAAELQSAVKRIIPFISISDSKYTLSAALLEVTESRLKLVATDGHRMMIAQQPAKASIPTAFLVSIEGLRLLLKMEPTGNARIASTDDHTFFQIGDCLLVDRRTRGKFPSYQAVIPNGHPVSFRANAEFLKKSCLRAGTQVESHSQRIVLELNQDGGSLSSRNDDCELSERLYLQYAGDPLKLSFRFDYLLGCLNACNSQEITISAKDNQSPVMIQDGDITQLLMPMRP